MAISKLRALQQFVIREIFKDAPTGVMRTLPNQELVDMNVQVLAQRLMLGGFDPKKLKNANQVENALNIIESRPPVQQGIKSTKSAKVFDIEGQEIPKGSKIMGGKAVKETEAEIAERIKRENKEAVERIKKQKESKKIGFNEYKEMIRNEKLIKDAIDNVSPGFVKGDNKYNAEIVAEEIANKRGLDYYDMDSKQRLDIYDEAFQALTKMTEDFAQGGRAGFANGTSLEDILKGKIPPVKMPDPLEEMLKKMTPEEKEMFKIRMERMKKGFEKKLSPEGLEKLKIQRQIREQQRKDMGLPEGIQLLNKGGRIGFKDGMTRRTFLKILGGLASIPIVGKILKPVKIGKTVSKVPVIKTAPVEGKPEWFDSLVNKVIIEGDDVTKKFATGERQTIHQKTLDDGSVVRVTEDTDQGAVRVEYESSENVFGDPVQMEYKRPLPDEATPDPRAEFTTAESGPVGRASGPEDYEIDIDEVGGTSIRDLDSDVSKLKEYATGKKPTIKEMMQNKRRKDKAAAISEDSQAQSDAVVRRQGDYTDDDFSPDFASGGIAGMLGE